MGVGVDSDLGIWRFLELNTKAFATKNWKKQASVLFLNWSDYSYKMYNYCICVILITSVSIPIIRDMLRYILNLITVMHLKKKVQISINLFWYGFKWFRL